MHAVRAPGAGQAVKLGVALYVMVRASRSAVLGVWLGL